MQLIPILKPGASPLLARECAGQDALMGVIDSIGEEAFGSQALARLNQWMPLCWWSVYRLFDDAPPTLHASGSFGVPDGTLDSWRVYRASLYRRDETFSSARDHLREVDSVLLHWHAKEIPSRHREEIYSRHGLRERLSIVSRDEDKGLMAINFYRHDGQAAFSDEDIDAVSRLGRPLLACVGRHLSLGRKFPECGAPLRRLTGRERDVCERLLKGWTHEGIAADLQLSPATVKTYRNRAFERLGIHHRSELFALMAGRLEPDPPR